MASLSQLIADVRGWLDRSDVDPFIPGWVQMTETDIATGLRARCMVKRATQPVDAYFIELPADWLHWEAIKDESTGRNLTLEDNFTGPDMNAGSSATAFRLVGNCIEFLPHPTFSSNPEWQPQRVSVSYYARPTALQVASDTNIVLETHYAVYLFGVMKYGALFELDDARAAQAAALFTDAVSTANNWKAFSDFSGGPLRADVRGF